MTDSTLQLTQLETQYKTVISTMLGADQATWPSTYQLKDYLRLLAHFYKHQSKYDRVQLSIIYTERLPLDHHAHRLFQVILILFKGFYDQVTQVPPPQPKILTLQVRKYHTQLEIQIESPGKNHIKIQTLPIKIVRSVIRTELQGKLELQTHPQKITAQLRIPLEKGIFS